MGHMSHMALSHTAVQLSTIYLAKTHLSIFEVFGDLTNQQCLAELGVCFNVNVFLELFTGNLH